MAYRGGVGRSKDALRENGDATEQMIKFGSLCSLLMARIKCPPVFTGRYLTEGG
jgi:hypothetical protein